MNDPVGRFFERAQQAEKFAQEFCCLFDPDTPIQPMNSVYPEPTALMNFRKDQYAVVVGVVANAPRIDYLVLHDALKCKAYDALAALEQYEHS